LKNLLAEGCLNKTKEEILPILTNDRVEDIRVRCCAVTSSSRAKRLLEDPNPNDPKNFRTLSYELDGENFAKFNGSVREQAAELWFQNYDLDGVSIPQMVLQVLSNCPVDTRKELGERILITGGTGMLPGLKGRLLKELKNIVTSADNLLGPVLQERFVNSNYTFKIYDPPVKENCVNWLGGALYGATEAMALRGVSKEFFLKHGLIPDWCDLQFDMVNALSSSGISAYGISSSGISRGYNS
jgi:actin-related protein 10